MADIPNRDELEAKIARLLGKYNRQELAKLMELMKNSPSLANIPLDFWDTSQRELVKILMPFSEVVYLQAAERMLETIPIGVDWALVNTAAADWARNYSTILAGQINQTSRGAVATGIRNSIATFFEEGLSIDEITKRLESDPKLSKLFTRDVRDRLGRIYGPQRAEMIAVTETTRASVEGQRGVADEIINQGIRMIEIWETANDEIARACPICWPKDGKKLGDGWTRRDGPPAHVRCRCGTRFELPKKP
ncbi:hypothetical protein KA005_70530 [bacterium]|nr:hypothetical protein [bacterium]